MLNHFSVWPTMWYHNFGTLYCLWVKVWVAKDHRWRIAVISWVLRSESLKKNSNNPYITFGRVWREILLAHPKRNSSIFSCVRHDWNFKRDWNLWSDGTKKGLFGSKHTNCVWRKQGWNVPMPTVKYTAGSLMSWAYFLYFILFRLDSSTYQQI